MDRRIKPGRERDGLQEDRIYSLATQALWHPPLSFLHCIFANAVFMYIFGKCIICHRSFIFILFDSEIGQICINATLPQVSIGTTYRKAYNAFNSVPVHIKGLGSA